MSLYISTNTASSELADSMINHAITFLAATMAIKIQHGMIPDGPSLDVTFMLPGKLDKPDFTGMRMGSYTKKNNTLFFEKAVPEHIVHSNQAKEFVAMVMQDVIISADEFFQESDTDFDIQRWQQLLEQLAAENGSQTLTHLEDY